MVRKLTVLGFFCKRQGKGSHEIWYHDETKTKIVLVRHSGKSMSVGVIMQAIKKVGSTVEEFAKL